MLQDWFNGMRLADKRKAVLLNVFRGAYLVLGFSPGSFICNKLSIGHLRKRRRELCSGCIWLFYAVTASFAVNAYRITERLHTNSPWNVRYSERKFIYLLQYQGPLLALC